MKKTLTIDREGMSLVDKILINRYFPEEVTDEQAAMMLHAIGADHKEFRTYNKKRYYHAYRNHYDAGGNDIKQWDDLVAKGYAELHRMYNVSVKGIHLLEYLTQCRIWGDYQNTADCRYDVMVALMQDDVYCGYGCWMPSSSKDLSLRLAIPRKLVLDTLNELAEEGLCVKGYYGEMDEDGCVQCKHGWYLTEQARQQYAEKYEELKQEEYKKINDSLREGE